MAAKEIVAVLGLTVGTGLFGVAGWKAYQWYEQKKGFAQNHRHADAIITSINSFGTGRSLYTYVGLNYKHTVMNLNCRTVIEIRGDPGLTVGASFDVVPRDDTCAAPVVPPGAGELATVILFGGCFVLFSTISIFSGVVSLKEWRTHGAGSKR